MGRWRAPGGAMVVAVVVAALGMRLLVATVFADDFDFVPRGGAELLAEVLDGCAACEPLAVLASQEKTAEEWREYFAGHPDALQGLTETEIEELTNYLAVNFPAAGVQDVRGLPPDGRQLVLTHCMLCHSIAIAITQDRSLDRWREHRTIPPHDIVFLTAQQWDTLAHYLTINTPVPLEEIPPVLREGGGGY